MDIFDTNFCGLFAMPTGLLLCFGPAIIVWLKTELGSKSAPQDKDPR